MKQYTSLVFFLLSCVFVCSGCTSQNEKALKKMARQVQQNEEDNILLSSQDSIWASLSINIWDETDTVFKGDRNFDRQVLLVKSQENFYTVVNNGQNTSLYNVIVLKGVPSPNSDKNLHRAILVFQPDGQKLKSPVYIKALGEIRLYFYESKLGEIDSYLSGNIICCIGTFPDGKIYGDLHKY